MTHTPDQTTATAKADDHQQKPQEDALGLGVSKLVAMLSNGKPNPAAVAELVASHPREQTAMYAFMQKTVGNSYVQRVIALAKPMMPNNVGASANVVDDVKSGHTDGPSKWGGSIKDGTANVNRTQDHADVASKDDKTVVTNSQHLNVGNNVGGPGQPGINAGGSHAVAQTKDDVERKTATSADATVTADSVQVKMGLDKDKVVHEDQKHGMGGDAAVKVSNTGAVDVDTRIARTSGDKTGTTTTGVTGGMSSEGDIKTGVDTTRVKNVGTNPDGTPITKTTTTTATAHAGPESSGGSVARSQVGADGTTKSASAGVELGKEGLSAHAGYSIMSKNGTGASASVSHGTTVHTTLPILIDGHWEVQYIRTATNGLNVAGSIGGGGFGASLGVGESAAHFDSGVRTFKDWGEAMTFRVEAAELLGPPAISPSTLGGALMIPIGQTIGTGNSNAISANGAVSFMGASLGAGASKTETHELDIKRVDANHVEVTVVDANQGEKHYGAAGLSINDTKSKTTAGSTAITYRFDLLEDEGRKAFEKFCKDLKPPTGGKWIRTETLDAAGSAEHIAVAGADQSWSGDTQKQIVKDAAGEHEKDDGTKSTRATAGTIGHVLGDKDSHASANLHANVENGKEESYTATIEVGGESGARNREALTQYFGIGDAKGTDAKTSGDWKLTADVSVDAVHKYEDKLHDFKGKTPAEKRQILDEMVAKGGGVGIHDGKPLDWDVELAGDKNFPGAEGRKELEHQLADYEKRVKDPKQAAGVLTEVDKTMGELAHRYVAIHDPGKYTDLPGELRAKVLDQLSRLLTQFRSVREQAQMMSIKNGDAVAHSHDPKAGESNTEIVAVQDKIVKYRQLAYQGIDAILRAYNYPIRGHHAEFNAAKASAADSFKSMQAIDVRQQALDAQIEQARSAYLKTADQPGVASKLLSLTKDKANLLDAAVTEMRSGAGALIAYIQPIALDGYQEFWSTVDGVPGSAANEDNDA